MEELKSKKVVDDQVYPVTNSSANEEKLKTLQKQVSNQFILWRDNRQREKEQHFKMGTLDMVDAAALGISLEVYLKIKNDARV